ncbi:MAG: ATP-binding cassette domain-containing protein, partial [Pseudomonadota bacterium]
LDLRGAFCPQIKRQGAAGLAIESGQKSGRKVIEARGITKTYGDNLILKPFTMTVQRGDRIALVGPNGVGKTTLLKILIGQEMPDDGSVKLGTNLALAVFDQTRAQLDPDATLWDSLTNDPDLGVRGQSDQVMVRGTPRHVVGYLKDFLFDERQARAPVRSLSGGEKARLLLAKILARPSNLLVLDEPTNDLDIETLDLLQDLLDGYDGTVLLVSHDRDFLDRVAVTTIAMEGDGKATVYAGGWSDYQSQRAPVVPDQKAEKRKPTPVKPKPAAPAKSGLSFTEKHRLDALPAEIERLEAEKDKLQQLLADPELFTREPVKFRKASEALAERQAKLDAAEEEWLTLAEKAEA